MIKGNIIMMNALHLNSTPLNGKVEVHGDSASGGGGIVPNPPVVPPSKEYIQFEDKAVEAICVANWSSDGIGLTMEDAAAVTTIDTEFMGNTEITSFNELEYFTNVKTLYSQTFMGCKNLTIVTSSHITSMLGDYHFHGCSSLREVRIPNCTNIASYDFQEISSLQILEINAVKTIGSFSLYKCINLGGQFNKEHLTSISRSAMSNTAITSLVVPSIATIGGGDSYNSAVSNCKSLTIVDLGASCTSIGDYAFNGCTALQTFICRAVTPPTLGTKGLNNTNNCPIYVPDASLEAYKTATNWNTYADRIHPLSEIEGSPYITFADAKVESVLMANGVSSDGIGITKEDAAAVTSISTWFKGNTAITSFNELQYFTGMTSIPKNAFAGCTNLKSCKISDSVTEIENDAFASSGIESISAKGVETIGAYSFYSCKSLKSADFPNVKIIHEISDKYGPFQNCTALQSVNMPYVVTIGSTSFNACPIEGKMVLLYLETMGKDVFAYAKITSFLAPKLKIIGNTSFYQCNNLEVMLLRDIESIAGYSNYETFRDCTKLKHFICLAQNVPSLATNVFRGTPINDGTGAIYVLDAKVDAYKSAANWSAFANVIKPYSQLATDNPTLYAEIQQYL